MDGRQGEGWFHRPSSEQLLGVWAKRLMDEPDPRRMTSHTFRERQLKYELFALPPPAWMLFLVKSLPVTSYTHPWQPLSRPLPKKYFLFLCMLQPSQGWETGLRTTLNVFTSSRQRPPEKNSGSILNIFNTQFSLYQHQAWFFLKLLNLKSWTEFWEERNLQYISTLTEPNSNNSRKIRSDLFSEFQKYVSLNWGNTIV